MDKNIIPKGYMQDTQGRLIPLSMISDIDKQRDELVREIVENQKVLSEATKQTHKKFFDDIDAFVDLSAEEFGTKIGGVKGNIQLTTFDGKYKVMKAIKEHIQFNEKLQVAKKLIDECIAEWSEGSRDEIKVLVNDAFYVDKQGKLNTNRILGLKRLNISDEKWQKAMDAIGQAVQVIGSKTYIRVYEMQDNGAYRQI